MKRLLNFLMRIGRTRAERVRVIGGADLKLSLRLLFKFPGLTVVASLGIAVGIAVCAGFFGFAQAQLYPRLPLDEGNRIVGLKNWNVATSREGPSTWGDFIMWRDHTATVVETAAFQHVDTRLQVGTWQVETVRTAAMTATGFTVARVPPLLGRFLTPEDERPDATPVLVIGFDVWRSRFAQDPSVVGQQVRLGDTTHTVVGVMPEGYKFPVSYQYWTPLRANPKDAEPGAGPALLVFGRLAPGATFASAQAELAGLGQRSASAFPQTHANLTPRVVKYTYGISGIADPGIELAVLLAELMMSLVLVVVAFNVAILVYARTAYRRKEIAIRTALGAGRSRIVMQLSAEALVLALAPAIAGLALAQYGLGLGLRIMEYGEYGGSAPFWTDYSLQPSTIGYALALVLVTVVIVGVLPALHATRRNVSDEIRQLGAGVRLGRIWSVLVVAQVAFAVAALPVLLRFGLAEMRSGLTRASYPIEEFLGMSVSTDAGTERLGHRLTELEQRLEAEPDIADVTFVGALPRLGGGRLELMGPTGAAAPAPAAPAGIRTFGIAPDYFKVYGLRLLAGRSFEAGDAGVVTHPVIVDRAFVGRLLKGEPAVGRRFRYGATGGTGQPSPWYEIVGVTDNLLTNPIDERVVPSYVFYPVAAEQISTASVRLHVRGLAAAGLKSDLPQRLHRLAASVDPALRLGELRPSAVVDVQQALTTRLFATGVTLVVGTVLLLSTAGVYALLSFTVAQRRREIGIRTALGAPPRRVLRSIFSRVAVQIGIGLLIGITAAIAIESPLQSAVAGLEFSGRRAIVLSVIAGIMLLAGFLAAIGPARRGLSIQPTEALKAE